MDFTFEELNLNAWPSIQTMVYEGWILRMANGYTKRSNSIIPLYSYKDGDIPLKIEYCENLYRKNNLPVIFKLMECEDHKNIDHVLEQSDYEKIDITSVQVCGSIKRNSNNLTGIVESNNFSSEWKKCLYECNEINELDTMETIETLLENIKFDVVSVHKKENGVLIGCGYGVIEKGFIGLFDINVKKDFRGKGYGNEIVQTILNNANKQGIMKAYLSVVDNNTVAKKLYDKLGFKEIYKYWYRKKL